MSFMKETLNRAVPYGTLVRKLKFVKELQRTLPMEKFKRYMIQDSICQSTMLASMEGHLSLTILRIFNYFILYCFL